MNPAPPVTSALAVFHLAYTDVSGYATYAPHQSNLLSSVNNPPLRGMSEMQPIRGFAIAFGGLQQLLL